MAEQRYARIVSRATLTCFLAFCLLGMAGTFLRENETVSYYENRTLAAMPTFTGAGVLDGTSFSALEAFLQDHAAGRRTILKLVTWLELYVLRRPVVNGVVVQEDILLPYLAYEAVDEAAIGTAAEAEARNLADHAAQTESYGGAFYYVAVPCQYVCCADRYPWYLNNREAYTQAASEALFRRLDELGVHYIDMLEEFRAAGSPAAFSSAVDNHYGISGAYQTYLALMRAVTEETAWNLEVLEPDAVTVTELENPYLGSRVRKLLGLRDGSERLSILTPQQPVPFTRQDNGSPVSPTVYLLPQTPQEPVQYSLYMGGDIASTVIDTERPWLPSILIYGDSFTNALECVAWWSFDKLVSLDFRYYSEMTLEEILAAYQPEIVVCVRDYEAMLSVSGNGA